MLSEYANVALTLQTVLAVVGIVLLWRYVVSPRARRSLPASPLPPWQSDAAELLILIILVLLGSFVAGLGGNSLVKSMALTGDTARVLAGAAVQFGMLGGALAFAVHNADFRRQAPNRFSTIVGSGVVTFIISLPILHATGKAWELLLQVFGIPAERQDLIRMFAEAKSPWLIVALVVLATVVAPVTEELIFRAGLFRFMRTRAPRLLALLLPGLIFASLHVHWPTLEGFASFLPLLVLALLFSLAYERTGHIGTVIVAHALFNLNTIILIFTGVGL